MTRNGKNVGMMHQSGTLCSSSIPPEFGRTILPGSSYTFRKSVQRLGYLLFTSLIHLSGGYCDNTFLAISCPPFMSDSIYHSTTRIKQVLLFRPVWTCTTFSEKFRERNNFPFLSKWQPFRLQMPFALLLVVSYEDVYLLPVLFPCS